MTTPPTLSSVSAFVPILIQQYERYLPSAFDDSLTELQKLNKVINSLNTLGTQFNTVVDQWNTALTWVEGDGLTQAVDDLLNQWNTDGTLAQIINVQMIGTLANLVTTDKSSLVNAINEVDGFLSDLTLNVKFYGAKGDGVTDDTVAIQTAIHSGSKIYFPKGTYLISSTLLVDNTYPTELFGNQATLKPSADIDMMRLKNATHFIHLLTFDGSNRLSGNAIIVEGTSTGSLIKDNTFNNVAASGVNVQAGASFTTIQGNTFNSCGWGINTSQPFNNTLYIADADDVKVLHNELLNTNAGVYFRGTTSINNYLCEGNRISCKDNTVSGLQGISNAYGKNARISGNYVSNFNDNAIDLNGCQYVSVEGNVMSGCKDGVFVGDNSSKNVSITGNVMRGCQRGVRIYNSTSNPNALIKNIVVMGNTMEANVSEGILASCTGSGSQMLRLTLTNNTIDLLNAGTIGVSLDNVGQSSVSNNRIGNALNEGIKAVGCDMLQILDNTIQDVSYAGANTSDMVNLDVATTRTILSNLICYGTGRYAVSMAGTGNTLKTIRWRSMGTGGVNDTGSGNTTTDAVSF